MIGFGSILVVVLGLLACSGLVLVVAGIRGVAAPLRRECRACRFDLAGLPDATGCPECGASLSATKSIRLVSKARRPRWVLMGSAMVAVALVLPLTAVVDSLWTGRLSSSSPTWLLAAELHLMGWRTPQSVAKELASRAAAGEIGASTLGSLARAVSVMHEGRGVPDELSDLVGLAATSGCVDKETVARHMLASNLLDADVPVRMRPDDAIVRDLIHWWESNERTPRDGVWWRRKRISAIVVDGCRYPSTVPASIEEVHRWAPMESRTPTCIMGTGMFPVVCDGPAVPAQPRLTPGRHHVTLEFQVEALNGLSDTKPGGVSASREYDVEVVAPNAPLVELVDDAEFMRQISDQLIPYVTAGNSTGVMPMCSVSVRSSATAPTRAKRPSGKPPLVGGAWTVLLDTGGGPQSVGTFRVYWQSDGVAVAASAPKFLNIPPETRSCRVILRANELLAVSRKAIDVMPAGDIVFDNVPVR